MTFNKYRPEEHLLIMKKIDNHEFRKNKTSIEQDKEINEKK